MKYNNTIFYGDLNESHFNEMTNLLTEAVYDITSYCNGSYDIMMEAAFFHKDKLEVITEAAMETVKEKIKTFFTNAVNFVKGIIDKIKLYLNGMSTNVEKWLKNIGPYIEKKRANASKFEYEGYRWNIAVMDKLHTKSITIASKVSSKKIVESMKHSADRVKSSLSSTDSNTSKEAVASSLIKYHAQELGFSISGYDINSYDTERKQKVKNDIEDILGTELSKYKEVFIREAKGSEKQLIKGFSNIGLDKMLTYIRESNKLVEKISEQYGKLEEELNKSISVLENIPDLKDSIKESSKNSDTNGELANAANNINRLFNIEISCIRDSMNAINGLRSLSINLTKECTQEFMSILTKFAKSK